MIFKNKKILEDEPSSADSRRQDYVDGIEAFINRLKGEELARRREFITPESLASDREHYREEYAKMLG